jgi:hypothetical protein
MESIPESRPKSYMSLTTEALEALSSDEKKVAYKQLIQHYDARLARSTSDGQAWAYIVAIEKYEQKLAELELL